VQLMIFSVLLPHLYAANPRVGRGAVRQALTFGGDQISSRRWNF